MGGPHGLLGVLTSCLLGTLLLQCRNPLLGRLKVPPPSPSYVQYGQPLPPKSGIWRHATKIRTKTHSRACGRGPPQGLEQGQGGGRTPPPRLVQEGVHLHILLISNPTPRGVQPQTPHSPGGSSEFF